MPRAGTSRSLGGTQSYCYRGDYLTSHPALRGQPPSQQPSLRLHFPCSQAAASCPKCRGKTGSVCQGLRRRNLGNFTTHTGGAQVGSSSFDPRVCSGDANPRSGLPLDEDYFCYLLCSAISNPTFQTFIPPYFHQKEAAPGFQKQKQNLHSKTLPFSTPNPV